MHIGEVRRALTRRRLLLARDRLEQLGRYLRGIDRDAGEARVMDRIALDDRFVLCVLERIGDVLPLLLTGEDQGVGQLYRWC
jgi:hypothetical protein